MSVASTGVGLCWDRYSQLCSVQAACVVIWCSLLCLDIYLWKLLVKSYGHRKVRQNIPLSCECLSTCVNYEEFWQKGWDVGESAGYLRIFLGHWRFKKVANDNETNSNGWQFEPKDRARAQGGTARGVVWSTNLHDFCFHLWKVWSVVLSCGQQ